jgi:hypothetical protein
MKTKHEVNLSTLRKLYENWKYSLQISKQKLFGFISV